jgi:hypothetical protein
MRRSLFVLGGVAVVGLLAVGAMVASFALTANSPGGNELRRALRTTYTTPASYTQSVERGPEGHREREEFRVWQSGWKRKVVQTFPEALAGYTVVQEGPTHTAYASGFSKVLKATFPGGWPGGEGRGEWHPLHRRPRITEAAGRLPNGRAVRLVSVSAGGRLQVRLWLDPGSGFILRQERYAPDGLLLDVTENRDLVRAPADLASALRPQPPHGAAEMSDAGRWRLEYFTFALRRVAPYPFLAPSRPLDGWRLVGTWPFEAAGTKVVAFRFFRRGAGFTLFEYPAGAASALIPQGPAGPRGPARKVRFYSITRGGLVVVAVGSLSAGEARELFASLHRISPLPGRESSDGNRTQEK